jgi:hypothetical protein
MPLPTLTEHGLLPEGVHDCTLEEARRGFGNGPERQHLWSKFIAFLEVVRTAGIFKSVIVDGSFISAEDFVLDIDVALVVEEFHQDQTDILKMYSNRQILREFLEDYSVCARICLPLPVNINYHDWFQNLKPANAWRIAGPDSARKGILRIEL